MLLRKVGAVSSIRKMVTVALSTLSLVLVILLHRSNELVGFLFLLIRIMVIFHATVTLRLFVVGPSPLKLTKAVRGRGAACWKCRFD